MNKLLHEQQTKTVSANTSNAIKTVSVPDGEIWYIGTIESRTQGANITVNDILVDGVSLGATTPLDGSIYLKITANNKVEFDVSNSAGSSETLDLAILGYREVT